MHYTAIHKKSTPYYPQANRLPESTNKILQTILKKIVNENHTYWDDKLQSALWAYRTTFKTSIQSTPFRMAFGLEVVMQIEFQVLSLRFQVKERLSEAQNAKYRLEQLLKLGEHRLASMAQLEHANDYAKPLLIDTGKARKKHSPSANWCSSFKHGSVPCRGNYGSDGPVPSG